jgi:tRNA threonylcarbamoyl adenosine modification protein YeaZ
VLLSIDTSAGTSVAVVDRDAGVLAERNSSDTRSHAELIGQFIADCLAESGVSPGSLSGVAVGMGPGPFTGLRVGIAAARAFGIGIERPIVPVVSHDAVAFGQHGRLLVVTDARRREVNWSTYSGVDVAGIPIRDAGPALARPEDLANEVVDFGSYRRLDVLTISAASLGMLAETLFANGRPFAEDNALYLRSPDVTMSAGPKRVS